ncbi:MAG: winged helix-turn-helix transcriptional regulator [Proteobacteria bacterium]|nr:winged helix-turn-helix transcriptional regulator [Pseudomonadota bacterium]
MSRRLVLQDFLPYLLNRAGMKIGIMFSRDVEPFGITLPMWRVLIELWHKGDHRLGELADRTSIDLSTLSRLLVTMQRSKLVVRRRSGLDRRALSLALTEKGLKLVEKAAPFALYYEDLAMEGMSKSEVAQLKQLLAKVFANLEAAARSQSTAKSEPKVSTKMAPKRRARKSRLSGSASPERSDQA